MEKKVTRRLAQDIRASLHEALDYAAGRHTKVVVHRVTPPQTDARRGLTWACPNGNLPP
jgi:hypothetical protein